MNDHEHIKPPKLALRFLRWYCNPSLIEEIEGDLYELFKYRTEEGSPSRASRMYSWDVIRFFRWSNIKRSKSTHYKSNNIAMFRNYLKISWRNLFKNALPSTINIFGMSIAVGIAITGFLYLDWQYSLDNFHTKSHRIYQVINYLDRNQQYDQWSATPVTLGPAMLEEISSVENAVRVERTRGIVRHEDRVFREGLNFVDPSFFDVFDYPVLQGNKNVLNDKSSIAISEQIARKFFGETDPIGKDFQVSIGTAEKMSFAVGAVFDNRATRTSMSFNILIPYSNVVNFEMLDIDDWAINTDATFVELTRPGIDSEILPLMDNYITVQNEANNDFKITKFRLQPLETLSVNSYQIANSIALGNQPAGNLFIAIIGAFLLILACINYMNISIGSTANRLKEIALRKVVGSGKSDIVKQFLFENIFICFIALILGVLLVKTVLLPGFNSQVPFVIPFEFSSIGMTVVILGGLLLFAALVSGAYPALYISRFSAIDIFRGKEKFGRKSILSRILLSVQFVLAFWTILIGLIFADTTREMRYKDWGYNQENLVVVPIKSENHFEGLKETMSQQSSVLSFTGSSEHIGLTKQTTTVEINSEKKVTVSFAVGDNYLQAMEVDMLSGRYFNEDSESDRQSSIIVNEVFAELLGVENPVGTQIKQDDQVLNVVGVVRDFHYTDFFQEVMPVMFRLVDDSEYLYAVAKVSPGNLQQVDDLAESTWKEIEPDLPYEGIQQAEVLDYFFQMMDSNNRLILFYSLVALILACMGLFGLVTFNTNRRMKEYSIHRIFGASTNLISKKITFEFLWLLIIGLLIGTPLGYLSMEGLLTQIFPERDPISFMPLIIGIVFVILTALATVSSQILKVIRKNPANVLRE